MCKEHILDETKAPHLRLIFLVHINTIIKKKWCEVTNIRMMGYGESDILLQWRHIEPSSLKIEHLWRHIAFYRRPRKITIDSSLLIRGTLLLWCDYFIGVSGYNTTSKTNTWWLINPVVVFPRYLCFPLTGDAHINNTKY